MVYCTNTDVYRAAGITSNDVGTDDVDAFILEAQEYLDSYLGTTFETKEYTETIDGTGSNVMYTKYTPVDSITSLDIDGTSVTTTEIYLYGRQGKLILKDSAEETTFKRTEPQQVVLVYDYGYNLDFSTITNNAGFNKIAYLIRALCSKIAGIQALVAQIGGTFDDVTSYQLPEFSASKGEPYTNIRETIMRLTNEVNKGLKDASAITKQPYFV